MLARERWQVATIRVLERVFEERCRQVGQYGFNRNLEDGTGPEVQWLKPFSDWPATDVEVGFRNDYEYREKQTGLPTWLDLVREELAESALETDPDRLSEELLQVAALCVSWVETIEARRP